MRTLITIILTTLSSIACGQNTWKTLGMVTHTKVFDNSMGMEINKVSVSPLVRALNGKKITIRGYIIPLTGKISQSHFMLSRYPESMCFFCGAAGPETAMQVFTKEGKELAYTNKLIALQGILRVNEVDAASLIYTLEEAALLPIDK